MRHVVRSLAVGLLIVLSVGLPVSGRTPARAADAPPTVNVTGTWAVTTTDPMYPSFTMSLVQVGATVRGVSGGTAPVRGTVSGNALTFCILCAASEDAYGGTGTVTPQGRAMSGPFWDGFGFVGTFTAARIR